MDYSSHFVARDWLFNIKNTNRKLMIDTRKIFPKVNDDISYADVAINGGNNLIEAIHIMQALLDMPKEQRVHKKKMKDFISKFEVG